MFRNYLDKIERDEDVRMESDRAAQTFKNRTRAMLHGSVIARDACL